MRIFVFLLLVGLMSLSLSAQKQVDMELPFLQGAFSELFTDKNVLVEGESAELEVQIARQKLGEFQFQGVRAYDCTWTLQTGYGSLSNVTGGTTTFKTVSKLPVGTAIATITADLSPTLAAQDKAHKAGYSFPKVILYIRLQQTNKEVTVLSLNEQVFTVEMKSNIQSPENMLNHYQQQYGAHLSPEQKVQFEAANAQISATKAQGQAKSAAANADLMSMSLNQSALLKDGRLILKIQTGGTYFNLLTGILENAPNVMYLFVLDNCKGVGNYVFPGTVGSLSVGRMCCACDADGECVEGTSGTLTIEEIGLHVGDKVKGRVHAFISDGLGNVANIDGHFVTVIGTQ